MGLCSGDEADIDAGIKVCKQLNLTVALAYCYLFPFWNTTLPASFLTNLTTRLGRLRDAGITALLNFAYEKGKSNFLLDKEPFEFGPIYGHIDQLAPILRENADVIFSLQAGFIGNAGEWAHDIRGLLTNSTGLSTMVGKLLYEALPEGGRHVLIRKGEEKLHLLQGSPFAHCTTATNTTPAICSGLTVADGQELGSDKVMVSRPQEPFGGRWQFGVVDTATANTDVAFARLGHYNAAFMSSPGDSGAFRPYADMRSPWFQYFAREVGRRPFQMCFYRHSSRAVFRLSYANYLRR
jgi:hypothetical protein